MHIVSSQIELTAHHRTSTTVAGVVPTAPVPHRAAVDFQAELAAALQTPAETDPGRHRAVVQEKARQAEAILHLLFAIRAEVVRTLHAILKGLSEADENNPWAALAQQRTDAACPPWGADTGPSELPALAARGAGLLPARLLLATTETTTFTSQGTVQTADGRACSFETTMTMSRATASEIEVALLRDPLVINYDRPAAALLAQRHAFDIDADGVVEEAPRLGAGSAYLAWDRNRDGQIADGTELFGPATGNGFRELAALDSDGNGWIDEGDPVWRDLRLWHPEGQHALEAHRIGAIGLACVETPFGLYDGTQRLGEIRQTATVLGEDGEAMTIQRIDIALEELAADKVKGPQTSPAAPA